MLLHEFAHVDAHHRPLIVEQEFGQRLGQLGLCPTPVGPRNRKLPIGRLGSCKPARARRTAFATAFKASSWANHPLTQLIFHAQQLAALTFQHFFHRHAGSSARRSPRCFPRSPRHSPAGLHSVRPAVFPTLGWCRIKAPRRAPDRPCAAPAPQSLRAWSSCSFSFCVPVSWSFSAFHFAVS